MMEDTAAAEGLAQALEELDAASSRMMDGDWRGWQELLTARDDVTLLGAYGGYVQGQAEVTARFARTASGYTGDGGRCTRTAIACWVGADLACTVDLERHETRVEGAPDWVAFTYRVTHLFRREEGQWRVVLRHADPLDTFRGPGVAHAGAVPTRAPATSPGDRSSTE